MTKKFGPSPVHILAPLAEANGSLPGILLVSEFYMFNFFEIEMYRVISAQCLCISCLWSCPVKLLCKAVQLQDKGRSHMPLSRAAGCPPEGPSGTLTSREGADRSGSQGGRCGLLASAMQEEMVSGRVGGLRWEGLRPQGLAAIPVAHGHHSQWFLRPGGADSCLCSWDWKRG